MGRIKTALIKRVTFNLISKDQGKLTTDYEKNKELVSEKTNVKSKKLRNVIAGYVTRLMKNKDKAPPRLKNKEDISKFYWNFSSNFLTTTSGTKSLTEPLNIASSLITLEFKKT